MEEDDQVFGSQIMTSKLICKIRNNGFSSQRHNKRLFHFLLLEHALIIRAVNVFLCKHINNHLYCSQQQWDLRTWKHFVILYRSFDKIPVHFSNAFMRRNCTPIVCWFIQSQWTLNGLRTWTVGWTTSDSLHCSPAAATASYAKIRRFFIQYIQIT